MDLSAQAATVWLRKWWIVGGALIAAVGVWLVTAFLVTPVYASTRTSRVVETGASDTSGQADTATYFAQTVAGLATTPDTLGDIVQRSGLPLTEDQVSARIDVEATSTPGFVSITGRAATPDDAVRLANATAEALGAQVERDNAAAESAGAEPLQRQIAALTARLAGLPATAPERPGLQRQVDGLGNALTGLQTDRDPQLLAGAGAPVPGSPESPTPLRDAAMGFLVALIVLTEGLVVWRAVRGRIVERGSAAAVERMTGLPAVELDSRETAAALLAPLYRHHLADADPVTVVQLGGRDDIHLGRVLRASADLARPAGDSSGRGRGRVRTVRAARVDREVIETLHRVGGAIVLAVDTARGDRRGLQAVRAALAAIGADVRGVIVWRGRFPREQAPDAPSAPTEDSGAIPTPVPRPSPAPRPTSAPSGGYPGPVMVPQSYFSHGDAYGVRGMDGHRFPAGDPSGGRHARGRRPVSVGPIG